MPAHRLSPSTTHRKCGLCRESKLLELFPPDSRDSLGRAHRCRRCKSDVEKQARRARGLKPRGPKPGGGTATPVPAMDLNEQLACIRFRKWVYDTQPAQLRATIGGGYV